MDNNALAELSVKVISGSATPDDEATLRTELEKNAEAKREHEDLQAVSELLKAVMPLTEAMDVPGPELPRYSLESLHTARRRAFGPPAVRQAESQVMEKVMAKATAPVWHWKEEWTWILRTAFAVGSCAILIACLEISHWSDSVVEMGAYHEDPVRAGGQPLVTATGELNGAQNPAGTSEVRPLNVKVFDLDSPFDQWQRAHLPWYVHGKVWVDNERNVLHVISRDGLGQTVERTEPLADGDEAQRQQILNAVESIRKR